MTQIVPSQTSNAVMRQRPLLTALVWSMSLLSLVAAGVVATALVFMASSLDPTEIISSGVEAWTDALKACGGFVALVCISALAIRLWHSRRFAGLGLALTIAQALVTGWACIRIYQDYV